MAGGERRRPAADLLVNNAIITLSTATDAGLAAIATPTVLDPFFTTVISVFVSFTITCHSCVCDQLLH